jgi:hypothetical protein
MGCRVGLLALSACRRHRESMTLPLNAGCGLAARAAGLMPAFDKGRGNAVLDASAEAQDARAACAQGPANAE